MLLNPDCRVEVWAESPWSCFRPGQAGWALTALEQRRAPCPRIRASEQVRANTLDAISVRGKAPSAEEGKAYLFEARLAEGPPDVLPSGAQGSPPWWLLADGPAVVEDGYYEFSTSHGLDLGRSVTWDGPKQEFRVLAQELRADDDTKHFRHALEDLSMDPSYFIGEAFVIGTGTTTLRRD
ncbi:hypothetical protein [Catellatospora sp. NPDC049609]|uniref:hypothetical protein n=1 Tax=Catellatospora sp. NPDC049609 TaxID=3155505 RepID=UPI0034460E10